MIVSTRQWRHLPSVGAPMCASFSCMGIPLNTSSHTCILGTWSFTI